MDHLIKLIKLVPAAVTQLQLHFVAFKISYVYVEDKAAGVSPQRGRTTLNYKIMLHY